MSDEDIAPAQNLPPLTGDAAANVARYPLSKGVPDVLLNKKMLASAMGVSTTTVDSWLALPGDDSIPYMERGTNGRSYTFRLSVAHAWRVAREKAEEADRSIAESAVAQYRFDLLGGSGGEDSHLSLSPKERAEALRVEKDWILAAAARRDYVLASDAFTAGEEAFALIRDGLDAAPDRLGREFNLTPDQISKCQDIFDGILNGAVAHLERKLAGDDPAEEARA